MLRFAPRHWAHCCPPYKLGWFPSPSVSCFYSQGIRGGRMRERPLCAPPRRVSARVLSWCRSSDSPMGLNRHSCSYQVAPSPNTLFCFFKNLWRAILIKALEIVDVWNHWNFFLYTDSPKPNCDTSVWHHLSLEKLYWFHHYIYLYLLILLFITASNNLYYTRLHYNYSCLYSLSQCTCGGLFSAEFVLN